MFLFDLHILATRTKHLYTTAASSGPKKTPFLRTIQDILEIPMYSLLNPLYSSIGKLCSCVNMKFTNCTFDCICTKYIKKYYTKIQTEKIANYRIPIPTLNFPYITFDTPTTTPIGDDSHGQRI